MADNPFYAEMGGQVSDKGYLKNDNCKLEVLDVIKCPNKQHLLKVKVLEGTIHKGDEILTHVNSEARLSTARNHSATHLLQKVLQDVLGNSVHQAGSRVDPDSFRFDFSYRGRLSDELILKIEEKVREKINENVDTIIETMPIEEAKKKGAMALFEDKYDKTVRVVTIGDSVELCGGTHVNNSSDIGEFAILKIENKGSDTYRVEGATGKKIETEIYEVIKPYQNEIAKLLTKAKELIKQAEKEDIKVPFNFDINYQILDSYADVVYYKEQLEILKQDVKKLEKDINNKITSKSLNDVTKLLKKKKEINNMNVIVTTTKKYDVALLKQLVDSLTNSLDNAFILLANLNGNNVNIICKTNINNDKINCGTIVKEICTNCEGAGGGNKLFAQGGGRNAKDIDKYLNKVEELLKEI